MDVNSLIVEYRNGSSIFSQALDKEQAQRHRLNFLSPKENIKILPAGLPDSFAIVKYFDVVPVCWIHFNNYFSFFLPGRGMQWFEMRYVELLR